MNYLKIFFTVLGLFIVSIANDFSITTTSDAQNEIEEPDDQIQVLNFGTFHMGFTTDAQTTEFDEHDRENQKKGP